jgi:hypothetical protein
MEDVLVIIHAPGQSEARLKILIRKLHYLLDCFDLQKLKIDLNPDLPIRLADENMFYDLLIFCWGLPIKPVWDRILSEYNILNSAHGFLAIDLFERHGLNGRNLRIPNINAGRYWSHKVKEKNIKLFTEGYYVKSTAPYGMRCILKKAPRDGLSLRRPHYILQPGDIEKTEIVKLIFDLFVNHDYTHTQIANLLTAQSIKPPGKSHRWQTRTVKTILDNPVYVGANVFKDVIRYNVFHPLIDKSTYYEAQAKIARKQFTRKEISSLSSNRDSMLWFE